MAKKTESIPVHLEAEKAEQIRLLAGDDGASPYLRRIIDEHLVSLRDEYILLHEVFGEQRTNNDDE